MAGMRWMKVLFLTLMALMFLTRNCFAQSIDFIKDGKIVVGAIATFETEYPEDVNKKLMRLTIIVNQALAAISGDELTEKRFQSFTNHICIKIDKSLKGRGYHLSVEKTDTGIDLVISGEDADNAHKAVANFLRDSFKLSDAQIRSLEVFVDQAIVLQEKNEEATTPAPVFEKIKDLRFQVKG